MAALLKAWSDSGFNRENTMSSNLIGPNLENDENEMEEPKVDYVEENQASILLNKN